VNVSQLLNTSNRGNSGKKTENNHESKLDCKNIQNNNNNIIELNKKLDIMNNTINFKPK